MKRALGTGIGCIFVKGTVGPKVLSLAKFPFCNRHKNHKFGERNELVWYDAVADKNLLEKGLGI